jgi:hypothetical protein
MAPASRNAPRRADTKRRQRCRIKASTAAGQGPPYEDRNRMQGGRKPALRAFASRPTFYGDPCTVDCSGHEAGYSWAEDNEIEDPDDCGGNSNSFIEGCESYAEEKQEELAEEERQAEEEEQRRRMEEDEQAEEDEGYY